MKIKNINPAIMKKSNLLAKCNPSNSGSNTAGNNAKKINDNQVTMKIINANIPISFLFQYKNVKYIRNNPNNIPDICMPAIPGCSIILLQ